MSVTILPRLTSLNLAPSPPPPVSTQRGRYSRDLGLSECAKINYHQCDCGMRGCRRDFSAATGSGVFDCRLGWQPLALTEVQVPIVPRDRPRREACRICARSACYARIVPNDVSQVAKLVCADNHSRAGVRAESENADTRAR